jgi:hypothetical protein
VSAWRVPLAVALVADAAAYVLFPNLRAIVSHHHWIFYMYLAAMVAVVTWAVGRLIRRDRPD